MMYLMPEPQSTMEIREILNRLVGLTISELQVFGINCLKSVVPSPADLTGRRIDSVSVDSRIIQIGAQAYIVTIDLQRTGRLRWADASSSNQAAGASPPTVRLLLGAGGRLDFTEPAKTKRIAVRVDGG